MKKLFSIIIAIVFISLLMSVRSEDEDKFQSHSVSAGNGLFTIAFEPKKNGLNDTFFKSDVTFILNPNSFSI